jgi:DNA-binding transcriptional regulator GbsR (MarR family)
MDALVTKMVLHWGEMGARWGINRTAAQIHALLHFTGRAWPADEICTELGVARSHVSNSLKELQSWGVVHPLHIMGERREHFQSIKGIWELFELLLDERKRREVDPTLKALREATAAMGGAQEVDPQFKTAVAEMLSCFEMMDAWYGDIRRMPLETRVKLVKSGAKLARWLR